MKKVLNVLLTLLILLAIFPSNSVSLQNVPRKNVKTFVFPASLLEIEEEAFASTSEEVVVFPNGMERIAERAFYNNQVLTDIYIAESVIHISDTAFLGNTSFTIHGIEGSYVQSWSGKNNIRFVENNTWDRLHLLKTVHVENLVILLWIVCLTDRKNLQRFLGTIRHFFKSFRPQDRPELYPINYRFP